MYGALHAAHFKEPNEFLKSQANPNDYSIDVSVSNHRIRLIKWSGVVRLHLFSTISVNCLQFFVSLTVSSRLCS